MPSRNRVPNAAELVSRSLNCTSADSLCKRSAMVNALTPLIRCRLGKPPAYDEQIIALVRARVQPQPDLWFQARGRNRRKPEPQTAPKKEPPFPAALKLITGRRQTEWTGA